MNKTIFALSLGAIYHSSPLIAGSPLTGFQKLVFQNIKSFQSFAPLFHSFSHNTNIQVEKSQFHNYLSRVLQYDALMFETIQEHQNYFLFL